MTAESTPSPITRLVPPLTIIALIIMIAGAVFHVATIAPPQAPSFSRDEAPAAPMFSQVTAWHARPQGERLGGWERPWGVDLIWFPSTPGGYLGGWNVPTDWAGISDPAALPGWITILPENTDAFIPRRRFVSDLSGSEIDLAQARELEVEDILGAADHYLTNDQLMRGVFLGGNREGVSAALTVYRLRLEATMPFDNLLGGLIIGNDTTDISDLMLPEWTACDEGAPFPCLLDLRGIPDSEAGALVASTLERFSRWLDTEVPKPAAPLPPFETIELAPINRPQHEL